jgi:diguanylate cyclase (GGDEF)-like protein
MLTVEWAPTNADQWCMTFTTSERRVVTAMVVDDDEAGLRMAARVLRGAGYTVIEASGPQEALQLVADGRRRLDILVTDIVLPGMLGHELAERIGRLRPGIPVLCMSGSPDRYLERGHSSCGPSDFLLKPFDGAELRSATAALLAATEHPAPAAEPRPSQHRRRNDPFGDEAAATPAGSRSRGLLRLLPVGKTLPSAEWERRHRCIVWILWMHAIALAVVGVILDGLSVHGVGHGVLIAPFAMLASRRRSTRRQRQMATTFGMLTSSALIVHLSSGAIEGHFHYFTSIVLLSLYEDWVPFLIAILYVLLQHGVMGTMSRSDVFDHGGNAWIWGGIHAAAVALTAAASALAWRLNEDVRQTEARVRDRLAHGALHDDLTGLPNRRMLVEELERASARVAAGQPGASVLFADIDHFKLINDSFGHSVGDRLLVDMAARLQSVVRVTDIVARSGGDEFIILARSAENEADALALAARIADAMALPLDIAGANRKVSLSMGISQLGVDDLSVADVLSRADAALYRAKADGRGRFQIADADVQREARRRMEVETALSESTMDQFELLYQPIVNLADGSVAAVEALLRWNDPSLGPVSPNEFIPIAEASGRILEIGSWVLEKAARQAVSWESAHALAPRVFVNVAGNQLTHPGFAQTVADALSRADANGRHIALELTETALAERMIPADTLTALERSGIDLMLDDFGTGYSSLAYLSQFPIAMIKLDRSFIAGCSDDAASCVILDAVAHLARGLGIPALAEGVETPAQLDQARARGYALAQGYLFARPQRAEEIDVLLRESHPFAAVLDVVLGARAA